MRKIILLIAIAISSIGYSQDVDVTFSVDMNEYTGTFTSVYVSGTFNSWSGDANIMDDTDADGVWEVTIPLAADTIEYKFTLDNWVGQENLTEGSSCTVTNSGFTNRYLEFDADVVLPVVCWESCFDCSFVPPSSDVTFKVDMNSYTGDFTEVQLNGTFNGWCGDCNPMTDADADGVWEVTLPLTDPSIEFKYTFDNWTGQEDLIPGSECTVTNGGFTNRYLAINGDTIMPVVCWNSCIECSDLLQSDLPIDWEGEEIDYTVVDFGENSSSRVADPADAGNMVLMTDRSATAPTWAGTTLHTLSGLANPIAFDADNNVISVDVYSAEAGVTVRLKVEDNGDPTKSCETDAVTTTSGAWETLIFDFTNEATGTAELNYTYTFDKLNIFYNFGVEGSAAGAQTYYCDNIIFGGNAPAPEGVTFRVDMNDYVGDFTEVQLNGTFNGWCGDCNPMSDDDADGVWEVTLPLQNDTIEYKFTFDNWTGQEDLTAGSECTITTDGFTNRYLEASGDTLLPVVCWNSCVSCSEVPSNVDVTFKVDMNEYTEAFTTVYVSGTFNSWSGDANPMSDDDLDGVWEATISLLPGTIEYKYSLDNWAADEALTEGSSCTVTNDGFTNRQLTFEAATVLNVVCYTLCSDCSGLLQSDLPIDWEGDLINYGVVDFGENSSERVAGPVNSENMVLQTDRSATAPTWAGTTLHTLDGLANPIPFDIDNNLITVDVYSPEVGVAVRLKAEDKTDPTHSVETEMMTTTSNEWESITFDFTNEATGTAEINYTYTFDMISIFYNFGVEGSTAGAQTYYCDNIVFGGEVATPHDVTFKVDMDGYTGTYTTVNLNGSFNGWCGACAEMTDDDGDNVYELTVSIDPGTIEYKFTVDGWTDQEMFTEGDECTSTIDGFTNRTLDVGSELTLDAVCWNSCTECLVDGVEENWVQNFTIYPNPSTGIFHLDGDLLNNNSASLRIIDVQGKVVYGSTINNSVLNENIDLNHLDNGVYYIIVSSESGSISEKILLIK